MVGSKQEFSCFNGWMRVKKFRRRINIACLQETKWIGEKAKKVGETSYKLWYTRKDRNKNGVGIIIV